MKQAVISLVVAFAISSASCSSQSIASPQASDNLTPVSADELRETLLLVSLADGSVIKQTISSNADICFKSNSDSATTCLTQGAPIFSPETDQVIGFEMIEERIDLVAKTD